MPKLIPKLFRSSERRTSSSTPYKMNVKSSSGQNSAGTGGIFRRRSVSMGGGSSSSSRKQSKSKKNNRSSTSGNRRQQQEEERMTIQPAITFTLSEDEVHSNNDHHHHGSFADVENQLLKIDTNSDYNENTTTINNVVKSKSKSSGTNDTDEELSPRSRTMTFTHLEIMRHELAHQMQLAARDREIHALQQKNEELKVAHDMVLSTKDDEINRLKHALVEVESVLSRNQQDLEVANDEQSKIIGVLMDTQVKLHEEKNKSWISPWLSFFDTPTDGLK